MDFKMNIVKYYIFDMSLKIMKIPYLRDTSSGLSSYDPLITDIWRDCNSSKSLSWSFFKEFRNLLYFLKIFKGSIPAYLEL